MEPSYRLLGELAELQQALSVLAAIWGEEVEPIVSMGVLRAYAHFGNPVIGAFAGDDMCGVSLGFLAPRGGIHLHSHVTGVLPGYQHLGVGRGLKLAQRDWCLEHGVDEVTWTFDPVLARNAYFNIHKLGASAWQLLPDFYGSMSDAINRGDVSDRLEVHWAVRSSRVESALADRPAVAGNVECTVAVPEDYHALRQRDPDEAGRVRLDVRSSLTEAFADGLEVVDFDRTDGYRLSRRNTSSS
jgi:predicted GNAT superfamily acetyltransferase